MPQKSDKCQSNSWKWGPHAVPRGLEMEVNKVEKEDMSAEGREKKGSEFGDLCREVRRRGMQRAKVSGKEGRTRRLKRERERRRRTKRERRRIRRFKRRRRRIRRFKKICRRRAGSPKGR